MRDRPVLAEQGAVLPPPHRREAALPPPPALHLLQALHRPSGHPNEHSQPGAPAGPRDEEKTTPSVTTLSFGRAGGEREIRQEPIPGRTVPTEPPPESCASGEGGDGRGRAVLGPPEKLEAVKVASSLGLQGPSAPIGAQLLVTGGSEDAPTVYHANLVAGSNTSVVSAALQQPVLASLNSAALASMQASAEANSLDIQAMQSMDWLFKKERIYLLAQFWQQTSEESKALGDSPALFYGYLHSAECSMLGGRASSSWKVSGSRRDPAMVE
ncbi:hypothetical protein KM043_016547 [Ampulex compressa]|nr:hypothetical protein KM043_016547 [Ampulex compressa]